MMTLKRVKPIAVTRLTADVRSGKESMPSFDEYFEPFVRELSLDYVQVIIDEALARFPLNGNRVAQRTMCDSWLAPRIHAALRLTRREAADPAIWFFLATAFPEYVQYRWGEGRADAVPIDRYVGPSYKQSFARLWWIAEMTRNGADYSDAETAMRYQDIPNTLLRLDAYHNRAFAIGIVRYIDRHKASSKQINTVITRILNAALVTRSLDALACMSSTADSIAIGDWVDGTPNVDAMLSGTVTGPGDFEVDKAQLDAVEHLIASLCDSLLTDSAA